MNGTLLALVVTGLLSLGMFAVVAVLVAAAGLLWLRRRGSDATSERPRSGRSSRSAPGQSEDRPAPASRNPSSRSPRSEPGKFAPGPKPARGAGVETEWEGAAEKPAAKPKPSRPPSRPPGPEPLARGDDPPEPPPIGFFDDETSTGQAFRSAAQLQSLSSAFLSVPPTSAKDLLAAAGRDAGDDDDEGEGATEIFSASAINAELAALLDEPEEGVAVATPAAPPKRR